MKIYNTEQAAKILNVSVRTLKYWRKNGKLIPSITDSRGAKLYTGVQLEGVQNVKAGVQKSEGCKNSSAELHPKIAPPTKGVETMTNFNDSIKEKLKSLPPEELHRHGILELAADKKSYRCPYCGNGSGEGAGDGINPQPIPGSGTSNIFNCLKCGASGDNIKLLAEHFHLDEKSDFKEIVRRGAEEFNLSEDVEYIPVKDSREKPLIKEKYSPEELKLIADDVQKAPERLPAFVEQCGGKFRGLTLATLQNFKCVFFPSWAHPKKLLKGEYVTPSRRLIIPTSERHYNAVAVDRDKVEKKFWKMHAGEKELFNSAALDSDLIFIVEGEIDAMSIYQAGFKNVCATAGAGNFRTFLSELDEKKFPRGSKKFVVMFDNDDAGRKNSADLEKELLKRGFTATVQFLPEGKDANDILMEVGDAGLKIVVEKIVEVSKSELKKIEKQLSDRRVLDEKISEKLDDWTKEYGEIDPQTLPKIQSAAKFISGLSADNITSELLNKPTTLNNIALCNFYGLKDFVTNFYSELDTAKEKAREDKTDDKNKLLAACSISEIKADVLKLHTEISKQHKSYQKRLKLAAEIEQENQRRAKFAGTTTKTACTDCPIELSLEYGMNFSSGGISVERDKTFYLSKNPVVPVAIYVDAQTQEVFYKIAVRENAGQWKNSIVSGSQLLGRDILSLADCGVLIHAENAKKLGAFFADLISANKDVIPRVKMYSQTGWQADGKNFFVYPPGGENWTMRPDLNFNFPAIFTPKGNADEWKKMFDRIIKTSSTARLTIGAVLSAPLIKILGLRNQQFHIEGDSGKGKTAAVKFGMSIFGDPEKQKFTFNGTANALDTVANTFCDLPVYIDEFQAADKKTRESIDALIYHYEGGVNRSRNTRSNKLQPKKEFRGVRITTGEQKLLNDYSGAGALNRLIEIHAEKVFDDDFAVEIHEFCKEHYGLFGRKWTEFIIKENLPVQIKAEFKYFEKTFREEVPGLSPAHYRFFALSYTALVNFECMISCRVFEDKYQICVDDFKEFAADLPTKDSIDNASRAKTLLQSFILSHRKYFIDRTRKNEKDEYPEIPSAAWEEYGEILNDGAVVFYPATLKKILETELKFPSANSLIRQFAEKGIISGSSNNQKHKYQNYLTINGNRCWAYKFPKFIELAS